MSQKHDKTSPDAAALAPEAVDTQEPAFELAFQIDAIPKIMVPDLPADAESLSAEALAQVPTLTDWVDSAAPGQELLPESNDSSATPAGLASPTPAADVPIQDMASEADTWSEELQVRMGRLTGDIQTLNARLDRLEEQNHTKA